MSRFNELFAYISEFYPEDWWVNGFQELRDDELILSKCKIYDRALDRLDEYSWSVLKNKASEKFKSNHSSRGKSQFFDLLNEALAYEYLLDSDVCQVMFIPESNVTTPDIEFQFNERKCFCEVKTINNSDEELSRYSENYFGEVNYKVLGEGFLRKLASDIDKAKTQISTNEPHNLLYFILNFDDFSGMYFSEYKQQLTEYVDRNYPDMQIYLREGLYKRFVVQSFPKTT